MELPIYSPLERVYTDVFVEKGLELWLKRDDMIHPLISGNKWRKLKYILKSATDQHKKHLVTFGGAYSNHLLATAAAAAKFGFQSIGWVRGEVVDNQTLFLCRLHGMQLRFISRAGYKDKKSIFIEHHGNDAEAFFIDEGGSGIDGARGCSEIVDEFDQEFDHVFCACGTGTTAAGIINGIAAKKLSTEFHGVPVLKNGEFMRQEIAQYLHQPYAFHLHMDYHFGGYAKAQPELLQFVQKFVQQTGVLIEPVYTGKMLYALSDLASQNYFARGSKLLAIHTGGLFGLFGFQHQFPM